MTYLNRQRFPIAFNHRENPTINKSCRTFDLKLECKKASKSLKSEPNYVNMRSKTYDTRSGIDKLFPRSFRSESCTALFRQSLAVL